MFSEQQISQRRAYLLDLLTESEAAVKNPHRLPKDREAARKICTVIACCIEELELVLGVRKTTMMDFADGMTRK